MLIIACRVTCGHGGRQASRLFRQRTRHLVDGIEHVLRSAGDGAENRGVDLLHGEPRGDVDRRLLERVELLVEHLDRGALAAQDLVERIRRKHHDDVELSVVQALGGGFDIVGEAHRVDVVADLVGVVAHRLLVDRTRRTDELRA